MKNIIKLTALALAGALALTTGAVSADKTKVGFIYIGPPGDHGWTYAHDQGRLAIEKELGDHVQTTFVENVPEGPDAERAIAKLAETGHELIFTTSFGYMEPTLKVAKRFPNVKFEHATGYKRADNVSTYVARPQKVVRLHGTARALCVPHTPTRPQKKVVSLQGTARALCVPHTPTRPAPPKL